jgi:hypothetical protein
MPRYRAAAQDVQLQNVGLVFLDEYRLHFSAPH